MTNTPKRWLSHKCVVKRVNNEILVNAKLSIYVDDSVGFSRVRTSFAGRHRVESKQLRKYDRTAGQNASPTCTVKGEAPVWWNSLIRRPFHKRMFCIAPAGCCCCTDEVERSTAQRVPGSKRRGKHGWREAGRRDQITLKIRRSSAARKTGMPHGAGRKFICNFKPVTLTILMEQNFVR